MWDQDVVKAEAEAEAEAEAIVRSVSRRGSGTGGLAGHAVNPSLGAHVAPSMALMVPPTHPCRTHDSGLAATGSAGNHALVLMARVDVMPAMNVMPGNERDAGNSIGRSTPCVDGRAQRGNDRRRSAADEMPDSYQGWKRAHAFWMQNACVVGQARVVPAAGRLPADGDQRRLKRCTASTRTCTWSGFMSGDMPWPRLKTWPSREPPLPWA